MNENLRIDLADGNEIRQPNAPVGGEIAWRLDRPVEALELRLFWYTEGRGDRDVGIARTLRIDAPGAIGAQPFELELPSGPYSFSGPLISLVWALELIASPGDLAVRREIVVGPKRHEVVLRQVAS
jgi:hypothetical protein